MGRIKRKLRFCLIFKLIIFNDLYNLKNFFDKILEKYI